MTNQTLSMSFTSGTLLYHESRIIADLFADLGDWDAVREVVVAENRLQMRTLNASKRICNEVISRLRLLTPQALDLLRTGTQIEQNLLLWLAVCKRYGYIYQFATELLREKFVQLDFTLNHDDYEIFFNRKVEWYPEVERVASSTQRKQRQVLFKMLREAGLLGEAGRILPALLTPRLAVLIQADDVAFLNIYPITDQDMRKWTDSYAPS